jgi:hypothetical protein
MATPSIGVDYPDERRRRVPIVLRAMRDTFGLIHGLYPDALLEPRESSAVLAVNCYFLLSNAYKRHRLIEDNRTYDYKVAAMTAAAIMVVRPMRFARFVLPDEDLLRHANFDCATRAATAHINVDLSRVDPDFVRRLHRATLGPISFNLPCLNSYLQSFDNVVFASSYRGGSSFDEIERAVPFGPFNTIDLRGRQLVLIENLLNTFLLMRMARTALIGGADSGPTI